MAKCQQCNKEYWCYDEDAGTYKEWFCSKKCEEEWEDSIPNSSSNWGLESLGVNN